MIVLGSKTCANNAKVTCYFHKFSFLSNQDNMQIQKRENNDNDYIHRRIKKIILSYLLKQSSLFLSHRRNSEKRWASPILSNKRVMLAYETNLEQRIQEANKKKYSITNIFEEFFEGPTFCMFLIWCPVLKIGNMILPL